MTTKSLTLTVAAPEEVFDGVLDAFARFHGWSESDAMSKEDRAKDALFQYVLNCVRNHSVSAAQAQAALAAAQAVEAQVPLTTIDLVIQGGE